MKQAELLGSTPGPWEVFVTFGNTVIQSNDGQEKRLVAKVFGLFNDEQEANARLIAAAPALLEVVKRLAYSVNGLNATERATRAGYSGSPLYVELIGTILDAISAIALTEGVAKHE